MQTSSNTQLVPLPGRRTREQAIAQTIIDCSSEIDIRYIKVWHLTTSAKIAAPDSVSRNFIRALHTYVPPQYHRYVKDMSREEHDAFDAEIARWVYEYAPQS